MSVNKTFTFHDGPPSANGLPGIHHMFSRVLKDTTCRYKRSKGFEINSRAGWDTHGLPVELNVEKELGISKSDIGTNISVDDFNKKCKESVLKYQDIWTKFSEEMGYSIDIDNPYVTYHSKYIESVWWSLNAIDKKGLLYKGFSIQPYSPMAGSGLSSHELNQNYKEITDTTGIFMFKTRDFYLLSWTTTPWTLVANVALAINKNRTYKLVRTMNKYSKETIDVVLLNPDSYKFEYEFIRDVKGEELLGIEYEPIFNYIEGEYKVIHGDFVGTDGTGVVHIAPTFGSDDYKVCIENNINIPDCVVDSEGRYTSIISEFDGKFVRKEYCGEEYDMNVIISIKLKENGLAFDVFKYKHNYPCCWRTDTPIIYYPLDSYFIAVNKVKDELINKSKEINWVHKATGEGRFGKWLENATDWNISRSRFWGIPIPIWKSETETIIISSVSELKNRIDESIKFGFMDSNPYENFIDGNCSEENYDIDLHKNVVDKIVLSDSNGNPMYRENDVLDVWYDSGAMSFAHVHYPFEGIHKTADFIAEGMDQTRGWFYTYHVLNTILFEDTFKNVIANGMVLDKDGKKMSKSKGNVVDPFKVIEKYGSDYIRFYMLTNSHLHDSFLFNEDDIVEIKKKFHNFSNSCSFYTTYSEHYGYEFDGGCYDIELIDKWILSVLFDTENRFNELMDSYDLVTAHRLLLDFMDDLSNWYIRVNRNRFWQDDTAKSALNVLYICIKKTLDLLSSSMPKFTKELYSKFNISIDINYHIDCDLINDMTKVRKIVSNGLAIRAKNNIRLRQPLSLLSLDLTSSDISSYEDILKSELNVKEIEYKDFDKKYVVNYRNAGKRFGKSIKSLVEGISNGSLKVGDDLDGIIISNDDVMEEIIIPVNSQVENDKYLTMLDIHLTEDLISEGNVRDVISEIQSIRRKRNFELLEVVNIDISDNDRYHDISENIEHIQNVTISRINLMKGERSIIIK